MLINLLDNIAHAIPATLDATRTSELVLYSDTPLTADVPISPDATREGVYIADFSGCKDEQQVKFANDTESAVIVVYNQIPDTSYLESWLTMQQMSYLIPVMKSIDWSKLKEATLKARQMSDLQGTEQALNMLLDLLDTDDNLVISRYWRKGDDIAFDDLHAVDLADIGYHLTNELRVQYQEDRINPWQNTVESTVKSMLISLQDVVTCIRHALPATLVITDYELIKVGLGLIRYDKMSAENSMQESTTVLAVPVDISTTLQYSYECFIYDLTTKELIRIAPYSEVNSDAQYMTVLDITVDGTIHDFCLHIDGELYIQYTEISGTKHFCITPPLGEHTMTYSFLTDAGNRLSYTKKLTVLTATSRQSIYELAEPTLMDESAMNIEPGNIANFMMQWMKVSSYCDGRPAILRMPKPYQQYFIPVETGQLSIRINDGFEVKQYTDISIASQIPGFTMSIESFKILGEDTPKQYYRLMTTSFVGRYDYTVTYSYDDTWHTALSITKILGSTVEPHWTSLSLAALQKVLGTETALVSIGKTFANNGNFMPVTKTDKDFCTRLQSIEDVVCNIDLDTEDLQSVATIADDTELTYQFLDKYSIRDVRRRPSFHIEPVMTFETSIPYIAYRHATWIELYSNDRLVSSAYGLLVFAKTTSNRYKLHLKNDYYEKWIEL